MPAAFEAVYLNSKWVRIRLIKELKNINNKQQNKLYGDVNIYL